VHDAADRALQWGKGDVAIDAALDKSSHGLHIEGYLSAHDSYVMCELPA
jgi:hypothetical protein